MPKILAFAGSARAGSLNARLARIAAQGAEAAGGDVTLLDLRDHPLPLYDADLESEQGLPESVRRLKEHFRACDGLLIASPEYNSSITALLKNLIDWMSRPAAGERPLGSFDGKVAALMSASPGTLGGLRGLVHVRAILGNIRVLVLPQQVAVPGAHEAFEPDGGLVDKKRQAQVESLGADLVAILRKLQG
jgi:NAD(P)H-dependent FMN reductase